MNLQFVRHKVRSNGVTTEFVRIFSNETGSLEWIGEIEPAKGVFRARFHQAFSPKLLREILEKWEAEAIA